MSRDPDITRVVRSWLDEGVDRLPDRVLDSVLESLPATPQRRSSWSAWRLPNMFTPVRTAIAAAAIVIAASAALVLLPRGNGPAASNPVASPSPSAFASPSPSATSSVTASVAPIGVLNAGRYRIEVPFALPFSITFPSSWTMRGLAGGEVNFVRSTPAEAAPWVTIDLVNGVIADPCHGPGRPKSPAPATVAELVTAITGMVGFNAGPITDVSLGGLPAKSFQITNSIDTDTANCTFGPMLPLWTFPGSTVGGGTNGGATERIWVLSVNGTLVVIDGETFPTTPAAAAQEIDTVVQSVVFE